MNLRHKAIEESRLTYSTGRPCRAGHLSERYTSNGMCIRCLKDQADSRTKINREARIKRNTSLINGQTERRFMLNEKQYNTVQQYADLITQGGPEVAQRCEAFINSMHTHHHTLSRHALLELLDYRDDKVHNHGDYDIYDTDTEVPYIQLSNCWYDAGEVMRVLREQAPSVQPTPWELFKRENKSA